MRLFTCGLSVALLSFCCLGLTGCAEDNEAASNEMIAKSKESDIPPEQRTPPINSMEEYAKRNPGMAGAGSGGAPKGKVGTTPPAPAKK